MARFGTQSLDYWVSNLPNLDPIFRTCSMGVGLSGARLLGGSPAVIRELQIGGF